MALISSPEPIPVEVMVALDEFDALEALEAVPEDEDVGVVVAATLGVVLDMAELMNAHSPSVVRLSPSSTYRRLQSRLKQNAYHGRPAEGQGHASHAQSSPFTFTRHPVQAPSRSRAVPVHATSSTMRPGMPTLRARAGNSSSENSPITAPFAGLISWINLSAELGSTLYCAGRPESLRC